VPAVRGRTAPDSSFGQGMGTGIPYRTSRETLLLRPAMVYLRIIDYLRSDNSHAFPRALGASCNLSCRGKPCEVSPIFCLENCRRVKSAGNSVWLSRKNSPGQQQTWGVLTQLSADRLGQAAPVREELHSGEIHATFPPLQPLTRSKNLPPPPAPLGTTAKKQRPGAFLPTR
jgi:hypothetical protein